MSSDAMPDVNEDETLRDVVAALSVLPAVSEADVQRTVARAAEGSSLVPLRRRRWPTWMPMAAAATLVLAAGIGGYLLRGATSDDVNRAGEAATAAAAGPPAVPASGTAVALSAAASEASAETPVATQFVLDAPDARRVALVGAFNGWDAQATPLVRDPATGLWTVTLPLTPGRHVYGFIVDDSTLTLDPRAPTTRDPDLGTMGSVILVGTP